MKTLNVDLGPRSYPIYIGEGLIGSPELFGNLLNTGKVMIVTDTNVEPLYLDVLLRSLDGYSLATHVIPAGEGAKNLDSMNDLISKLLENRFDRKSCLVALGGGVVGDLTGFTAACYQRGIDFLQVPTTLLAQVDSSVGGKTAVNHRAGKNMIGAFHQPCGVIADVSVLQTLPEREFSAGMAEVIKYGLIRDAAFFSWLEENIKQLLDKEAGALAYAVERSCMNKAEVVALDETEQGLRAILNLGHTFGHAIETGMNYMGLLHGEAVALGMIMASELSVMEGLLQEEAFNRIVSLIKRTGLPVHFPEELAGVNLRELMAVDKKASHGKLKLILLNAIGEATVSDTFSEDNLLATINLYQSGN